MSKRVFAALGVVGMASFCLCWAQGTQVKTAPQVVAGEFGSLTFVTRLTFQNRLLSDCTAEVLFHRGPGQTVDAPLLVNGEAVSNPFMVTVPNNGTFFAEVSLGSEGLFQGAARIRDDCGQLSITAGYDIGTSEAAAASLEPASLSAGLASTTEVFNYGVDSSRSYSAGNSFFVFAPIDYEPGKNSPGIAVVADPERTLAGQLCFDVLDSSGDSVVEAVCMDYDGAHSTFNLNEVFPTLDAVEGQWMAWIQSFVNSYVNFLFIDVNTSMNQFRQTPHIGRNGGCLESSPPLPSNPCLNNYRFSVEMTASNGAAMTAPTAFRISDTSVLLQFPGLGPDNFDLTVQVIDGCALNGHFWVFAAASTNVEYMLSVTDRGGGGGTQRYTNAMGETSPAIADTTAFATCP